MDPFTEYLDSDSEEELNPEACRQIAEPQPEPFEKKNIKQEPEIEIKTEEPDLTVDAPPHVESSAVDSAPDQSDLKVEDILFTVKLGDAAVKTAVRTSLITSNSVLHPFARCTLTGAHAKCEPIYTGEFAKVLSLRIISNIRIPSIDAGLYMLGLLHKLGSTDVCKKIIQAILVQDTLPAEDVVRQHIRSMPPSAYHATGRAIRVMQDLFHKRCLVQKSALKNVQLYPVRLPKPTLIDTDYIGTSIAEDEFKPMVCDEYGSIVQYSGRAFSRHNILSSNIVVIGDSFGKRLADELSCEYQEALGWKHIGRRTRTDFTISSSVQYILLTSSVELVQRLSVAEYKQVVENAITEIAIGIPVLVLPPLPRHGAQPLWDSYVEVHKQFSGVFPSVEFLAAPRFTQFLFLPNLIRGKRMDEKAIEGNSLNENIFEKLVLHLREVYSLPEVKKNFDPAWVRVSKNRKRANNIEEPPYDGRPEPRPLSPVQSFNPHLAVRSESWRPVNTDYPDYPNGGMWQYP